MYGSPLETGALETDSPSGIAGFSTITNFTGGNSLKKTKQRNRKTAPRKKEIPHPLPEHHCGCGSLCLLLYPSDQSGACIGYVVQGRHDPEGCVWQDTGDFHHRRHRHRFRRPAPYELFQVRQDSG